MFAYVAQYAEYTQRRLSSSQAKLSYESPDKSVLQVPVQV